MIKHHGSRLEAAAAAPPAPMVAPLNRDAAMEDWPTFCAEGEGLQKVVAPSGEGAWQWVDEGSSACPGCHKYGFASKEVGRAARVVVEGREAACARRIIRRCAWSTAGGLPVLWCPQQQQQQPHHHACTCIAC
jgi:hypothetical protein